MMESLPTLIAFFCGCTVGAGIFWLTQNVIVRERSRATKAQTDALTSLRGEIEDRLKILAGDALEKNQKSFLELARAQFDANQKVIRVENDKKEAAIKSLLKPVSETLREYKESLAAIEAKRQEAYGNISQELENVVKTQIGVRDETKNLVNALRANPKTRGRWGEETLKNVMELSGMSQHCDFDLEQSFNTEDGKLRPDVIVHLPGGRHLVIDAKTSTSAYMDAIESSEDNEREKHLSVHANQIRQHMKQLSAKAYWDGLTVSPDFVVMFIPGDNFFSAAIERDPNLFEDAIKGRVLITTPTTLIALAKAVSYGWRQEKVADNYAHIAELGSELYKRTRTMGGHLNNLGKGLHAAVSRFNELIGSVENSVLPHARKFEDLEVQGSEQQIEKADPVELAVREPRKDRDLLFMEDTKD
ncbi:MAG: DNA recombination protein RmuC [Rhodospirillaceae bacterium]|nr:DNA recombination protein RmuC [Rhodospirillaceae bacterium]